MPEAGQRAQRTCLGCRQTLDRDRLVRYVLSPKGDVLVDYRGKLPGRGAYTHIDAGCILTATKRRQFDRALRGVLLQPSGDDLVAALVAQIRERVLNLLGMARKSGSVISGSTLVLDTLRSSDRVALVLIAEDVSEGIGKKILAKAEETGVPHFRLFGKGDLGQQVGKGERSVVALKRSLLADALKIELFRYKQIVGES